MNNIIQAIVVINNITDKEYTFKSGNEHGLTFSYNDKHQLLVINQMTGEMIEEQGKKVADWRAVSRLQNFSIIKINFFTDESGKK